MKPRTIARVLVLGPGALAALAGGCSIESDPSIRLSQITMGQRTDEAVVVVFTLAADNPNDTTMPTRSVEYSLAVDGRPVFSGTRSPEMALRDNAEQAFRLPAPVPIDGGHPAPRGRVPFTLSGVLEYYTPGKIAEILFDTGVRRPKVPFAFSGTIDFDAPTGQPAADIAPAPARVRPEPPKPAEPERMDAQPVPPARPSKPIAPAEPPTPVSPPPPPPTPAKPAEPMQPAVPAPAPAPAKPVAPPPPPPPPPPTPPREGFVPGKPIGNPDQPKPKPEKP